ncbi:MAG: TetR/AcrR family transcriptional regulator [Paludibacteraceae bacterium]|nr:TetR/AcrR family transcriptional regulator [Paludibacteraceae bacterium]
MADIKEEILKISIARMQQVGIRSVSIDDICHELGISKKTFYVYFPSKDELLVEILAKHQEKVSYELAQSLSKRTVEQSLIEWAKIAKHAEKQMIKTPPMIYDLEKYYPQLFKQHKAYMRSATEEILMKFLQNGINEGVFRKEIDIKIVAMVFLDIQYRLMEFVSKGEKPREEILRIGHQGMDILVRGILTEDGLLRLREKVKNNI